MTNYEKLISSVLLSAVLSGQTFGWGICDCDKKETEEIPSNLRNSKNLLYSSSSNNLLLNTDDNFIKTKTNTENNGIFNINNVNNIEDNITEDDIFINEGIKKNDFSSLLALAFKYANTPDSKLEDQKNKNIELFNWQIDEINNKSKVLFGENNVEIIDNVSIEELTYIEQIEMIGLVMKLIDCLEKKNDMTLEDFSKEILYHTRKHAFNDDKNTQKKLEKPLSIGSKSNIKPLFVQIRNSIFKSLCKYVYEYLNLGYDKFGASFYQKDLKNEKIFSEKILKFYPSIKESDKNKSLSVFIDDENLCQMKFSDIEYIKGLLLTLPNFDETFILAKSKKNHTLLLNTERLENNANNPLSVYKNFSDSIKEKYNIAEKPSSHLATLLNFINTKTEGQNDPEQMDKNVKKTILELADVDSISVATMFYFKEQGLKVANIKFDSMDVNNIKIDSIEENL